MCGQFFSMSSKGYNIADMEEREESGAMPVTMYKNWSSRIQRESTDKKEISYKNSPNSVFAFHYCLSPVQEIKHTENLYKTPLTIILQLPLVLQS